MLCCQFNSKINKKLVFSWFLPNVLTGWPILPKSQPMIWRTWLVEKVGGVYCLGEGEYFFSVNNQRYERSGKVTVEEALCCQFKSKID